MENVGLFTKNNSHAIIAIYIDYLIQFYQLIFYSILTRFYLILVTRHGSGWHVASATIESSYKAFSTEKIVARIGAHIGLDHVNITLYGKFL